MDLYNKQNVLNSEKAQGQTLVLPVTPYVTGLLSLP